MKINSVSFKGTYKLLKKDVNDIQMSKILSKQHKFGMSFTNGSYLTSEDHFFIQTPDNKSDITFRFLNKLKVPFVPLYKQDTLDSNNIISRVVLSKYDDSEKYTLKRAKTEVLEEKFKQDGELYVAKNGMNGTKQKYDRFKSYLETNEPILAPRIYFNGDNVRFYDGRHRFAVLRDLGLREIPVSINKKDIPVAQKIGLF